MGAGIGVRAGGCLEPTFGTADPSLWDSVAAPARQRCETSSISSANSTDGSCCLVPGVKPCCNPPQKSHLVERVY